MDKLAETFAELAKKIGPDAIEAAKGAAQMQAYSQLMGSILWIAAAYLCWLGGKHLMKFKDNEDWGGLLAFFGAFGFFGAFMCASTAVWAWIDPWTWTAINRPELWIAKKVIGL